MRALSQGASRRRDAGAHDRASADGGSRCGRGTPRAAHLSHSPAGVVLAGGTARRFGGRPKGLELIHGVRIVDRVARAISAVTSVEILAANDDEATTWLDGVVIAADKYPRAGGMAGVHAALSLGKDVLVVAWDMPFVDAGVLQALVTRAGAGAFTAVVPESRSPIGCEPFCALYATAALPPIESYLAAGGGPAHSFLRELPGVSWLPLRDVARFGDPERLFFSVNTAADLDRARAMAETTQ